MINNVELTKDGLIMINNVELTKDEKKWLEFMLQKNIPEKYKVVEQINQAHINREYTEFYLSLKFKMECEMEPIITNTRILIEMRVYKDGEIPIQFLLHSIQGYVSELEIFKADSSQIDCNIILDGAKIEII